MNLLTKKIAISALLTSCFIASNANAGNSWFKTPDFEMKVSLDDVASSLFASAKHKMSSNSLTKDNAINGKGKISYVIDGDTVWVSVSDADFKKFWSVADTKNKKEALRTRSKQVKMRIGGINTAESKHKIKWKNTKEGKKASNYLKSWASNGKAAYDCYDHGKYGRPICIVIVNGRDIGYDMIKNGYSDYVTAWGKHPYFDKEYRKAAKNN